MNNCYLLSWSLSLIYLFQVFVQFMQDFMQACLTILLPKCLKVSFFYICFILNLYLFLKTYHKQWRHICYLTIKLIIILEAVKKYKIFYNAFSRRYATLHLGLLVGLSTRNIFHMRAVFVILPLPNHPRLSCRLSSLVFSKKHSKRLIKVSIMDMLWLPLSKIVAHEPQQGFPHPNVRSRMCLVKRRPLFSCYNNHANSA